MLPGLGAPSEDRHVAIEYGLQRLARGRDPFRVQLWLQRLEAPSSGEVFCALLAAARQGDVAGAEELWRRLRRVDLETLNLLLSACGKADGLRGAAWLRRCEERGLYDFESFQHVMSGFAVSGAYEQTEAYFQQMISKHIEATTKEPLTFSSLFISL